MPNPRPETEELALATRRSLWLRTARTFLAQNCDDRGRQLESNITPNMAAGIKSLRKRIKESEIVIVESDKGKVTTVSSFESYMRQGHLHTAPDKIITLEEARQCQINNNNIARVLGNVFNISTATGGSGRE